MGEGRTGLLESIDRLGSITGAANQVGISYRRAWSYLQAMEARLGVKLVETQRGGEHGGGARLTEKARVLIKGYQELLAGMGKEMRKRSKGFFLDRRYAKLHNPEVTKKE